MSCSIEIDVYRSLILDIERSAVNQSMLTWKNQPMDHSVRVDSYTLGLALYETLMDESEFVHRMRPEQVTYLLTLGVRMKLPNRPMDQSLNLIIENCRGTAITVLS
jgi:hypothetical protein